MPVLDPYRIFIGSGFDLSSSAFDGRRPCLLSFDFESTASPLTIAACSTKCGSRSLAFMKKFLGLMVRVIATFRR